MKRNANPNAVAIQRDYYAHTANYYSNMHLIDNEHERALKWIYQIIQFHNCKTVLDVGCGTGRGVKFLLERNVDVLGIEPVEELLKAGCRDHDIPKESMLVGNGEKMTFADNSFDASMELGVLHHVSNPEVVVSEMMRVTKTAIFLSDCNRFGQGSYFSRLVKLAIWKLRMWGIIEYWRTSGKRYTISSEDGLAYSYSVYDSYDQLSEWADEIIVIPTSEATCQGWVHPLLTTSHVLLVAIKN